MPIKVLPDGSFEVTTVADALALSAALRGEKNPPRILAQMTGNGSAGSSGYAGAALAPATMRAEGVVRLRHSDPQAEQWERVRAFFLAFKDKDQLTSDDVAKALGVERGKGLGSSFGQVKRAVERHRPGSWKQLVVQQRSPDRSVGMVLTKGSKFAEYVRLFTEGT